MVPEPDGIAFHQWVAWLRDEFPGDDIPMPVPEAQWVEWAMRLLMINTFGELLAIDPRGFASWQEYARRLKQQLGD